MRSARYGQQADQSKESDASPLSGSRMAQEANASDRKVRGNEEVRDYEGNIRSYFGHQP